MRAFSTDQIEALAKYHRYRFFEEMGWTLTLLFFIGYAYILATTFDSLPYTALMPFAIGGLLYALYQLIGSVILINKVHATGVRTGEAFVGERMRWFTIWSPIILGFGIASLIFVTGLLGGALLLASGVLASSLARLTVFAERNRFLAQLEADNPGKRVKHIDDVLKQ